MMLGEPARLAPTLQVATWDPFDDPIGSPFSSRCPSSANAGAGGDFFLDSLSALHRFLPSNNNDSDSDLDMPLISCDQFRMFEFKVRRCARGRSHDWTECPYAHPGEKARRRDPRKYHYSGSACPDFRKVRISRFLFSELEVASAKQNRHPRKQHQMKTLIMMKKSQSITISNL